MKYKNAFYLENKVAVVIGAAGLIGREVAIFLAGLGAVVVLADKNLAAAKKLENEIKGLKLKAITRFLDVSKEKSVSGLIYFLDKRYARIDIWVNSAYPRTKDWGSKFEDISLLSWRKNIDMHLNGYFLCSQKIAEYMKRQKSGSVINLASVYGFVAPDFSLYKGTSMTMPAAYSVIKAGIINFSKYLARYYGRYRVRVNCVSPGGVYDKQPRVFINRYIKKTALGRMANSKDVAGAVAYLASDASGYVTGHNLVVDGGFSIS